MDKPWKVILAFIGVFIAGAVFGGVFTLRASGKRFVDNPAKTAAMQPQPQPVPAVATPGQPKGPPQSPITVQLMRQFTQKLKLSNSQKEKIRPLVTRAGDDMQRLGKGFADYRREYVDNSARVMERMYADVSEWLTPEQRYELDEMQRQWREKIAKSKADAAKSSPPAAKPAATKKDAVRAADPRPPGP